MADAEAVHAYYQDVFELDDEHLFLLTGEEATLKNIRSLLGTRLRRLADEDDIVVIYFSGHGVPEEDSQGPDGVVRYLMPHDGDRADLYSMALAMDEVARIFSRLHAGRVVFIADTCFSGEVGGRTIFDAEKRFRALSDEFLQHVADAGKGRIVLAASRSDQVAQERTSLGHGVFTHYLLEGLQGAADISGDAEIDLDEIFPYVRERVEAATGRGQGPVFKGEKSGRVVLGRVRN